MNIDEIGFYLLHQCIDLSPCRDMFEGGQGSWEINVVNFAFNPSSVGIDPGDVLSGSSQMNLVIAQNQFMGQILQKSEVIRDGRNDEEEFHLRKVMADANI